MDLMTVAHPDDRVPPPGRHGGDGPAVAAALGLDPAQLLDLSQNLNPFAPDVTTLLVSHLDTVRHYPDPRAATVLLAEALGIDPARLLLTNGGSEAISLVSREMGGRVAGEPEFALHPRHTTGPVWRSDPHSPSGRLATLEQQADVWDEAFYPLATGQWTAGRGQGMVTVGSLTKTFACPGLRLGYLVSDDIDRFARHQPHWSVSSPALATLPDLLERADLPSWAARIAAARSALSEELTHRGLALQAADAPWVLVAAELREVLARFGVLVRDCTSFGMPGVTRIAVPDATGLDRLVEALDSLRQIGASRKAVPSTW